MTQQAVLGALRATQPRTHLSTNTTNTYSTLLKQVRDEGLLERRVGFYAVTFGVIVLALAGAITGFILLGDSWFQLLIAAAVGIIMTQFAYITHEASHRQIFASGKVNDRVGRILAAAVVGMSYTWWMNKHNRHHVNPNTIGKDPDIEVDTISFLEEDAQTKTGLLGFVTRRQGYLFFFLLLFAGANLHFLSVKTLIERTDAKGRTSELIMLGVRLLGYFALVLWFLPLGMGFAFLGVQLAVFGLLMGGTFAPNHKGMPLIPEGVKVDFLSRQVLTSRNISGGYPMTMFMGGLNYQIEHHLFPNMARPYLARAQAMVREHCATHEISYTETTLLQSYGIVVRYLNRVGLAAQDPFDCPPAAQFRRR